MIEDERVMCHSDKGFPDFAKRRRASIAPTTLLPRPPMTAAASMLHAGEGINPDALVAGGNLGAIWANGGAADPPAPMHHEDVIEWLRPSSEDLESIAMVRS